MPRVLFIAPFIWEAGPHKGKPTIDYIMRGFRRAGYEVHVVSATNRPGLTEATFEGLHVHYIHPPVNPVDFTYDALHSFLTLVRREPSRWRQHLKFRLFWLQFVLLGIRRAMQVAREHPPNLVYGVMNTGIPVAAYVGRRLGVPNISRITGSYILKWADSPLTLLLFRFDEYLAFKLPCAGLVVTQDGSTTVEALHQRLGIPKDRIWLLRNGIDKATFTAPLDPAAARRALGLDPAAKVVLSVSQLVDVKRVDRLIDAVPAVVARCPDARFVIVGDGPDRAALEQQAERLDVARFVRFEGFVARAALPTYYHAADVFAAFYPYSNVSNSLLEAMLSGNAVVTLNNGQTGEVVTHRENGLLIEPDRLDEIPTALTRVLQDDDLRRRLGHNAARYADRTLLSWDERIDREIARIEAILHPAGRAQGGTGTPSRCR